MARGKRYQPEQVVNLLRQIEVAVANGRSTDQACREASITQLPSKVAEDQFPSFMVAAMAPRIFSPLLGRISFSQNAHGTVTILCENKRVSPGFQV
jgi:hypothetical protein